MRIHATIITQSFKHIVASGPQVVDQAYDLMQKMYPELASIIDDSSYEHLKSQLLNALIFLVDHFDEEQAAIAYLQTIGKKLRGHKLKPQYFDELKDVLIRSIGAFLNEKWTPKAKEQWNLAFEFINYHVVKSANLVHVREYQLPIFAKPSEKVLQSEHSFDSSRPEPKVEPSIKASRVQEHSEPSIAQKQKEELSFDGEFADIFAQFEPELEAFVSLSSSQIEQIKQGAASFARALVSKHWEKSFKAALEEELTEIEDGEQGSSSNPEAA